MAKRKSKVLPEGLHPIAAWRLSYDFSKGELATMLICSVKVLADIEDGLIQPTDEQKKRIRLITGIIL